MRVISSSHSVSDVALGTMQPMTLGWRSVVKSPTHFQIMWTDFGFQNKIAIKIISTVMILRVSYQFFEGFFWGGAWNGKQVNILGSHFVGGSDGRRERLPESTEWFSRGLTKQTGTTEHRRAVMPMKQGALGAQSRVPCLCEDRAAVSRLIVGAPEGSSWVEWREKRIYVKGKKKCLRRNKKRTWPWGNSRFIWLECK